MDKLREEIGLAILAAEQDHREAANELAKVQARIMAVQARISAYRDVLGTMDELAEAEPVAPDTVAAVPSERSFGTGRAPRRDVQGAVKRAVRDYLEAKGIGPRLEDVVIGAGILLGSDVTESAARRALDAMVGRGELFLHDGRYAPYRPAPDTQPRIAEAAK